ncbi:hypothetical protein LTR62_007833 [Meristemomyces frigidus]|uniref:Alpha-1,2-mannosyltransferase n=1 Tax=Meristemomyces frigidus TaxID=1508187 RepID=A0AAN7YHJ4_9PEZI|nr:hypothetical protein LTR62_007833 [Meristemomyces frigidus]
MISLHFELLAAALGLLCIYLGGFRILNNEQRTAIIDRFCLRRKRAAPTITPPQSLSLDKQGLPTHLPLLGRSHSDAFPPSRRHVLEELSPHVLKGYDSVVGELTTNDKAYGHCWPDSEDVDADECADYVTATGFTVREIKDLGVFPDYAELSGISLPSPYTDFDINKAVARPYRPFRWAYHQTMSLAKMDLDWWLELEQTYADRIQQRKELFDAYGEMMLQRLPGSALAVNELMEMCLQFLCARYPQYFRLDMDAMTFHNGILKTSTNLRATEPLQVLLHNVPEDFAIMIRNPTTGLYNFRAGIICSSLGWNLGSKIGLNLNQIHDPVPDYLAKMQFSMDRYFAKMPTDKPIQRGSWGFEIDTPLFMPPGDPQEQLREGQDPSHTIDRCHLRVDWQTLRRLPLSGAIVFNFKAVFTPVTRFRDEPYVPSLILKVLKEGKKEIMQYKNTWHTKHVVIPALEEYEREQVKLGLIDKDWEPRTLDESPFYPGWEEKWHRLQGF